ncbi:hypothetical protein TSOC_005930 [Tetrabaena socialis]|uniref:Outer membrane protein pmp6 n=1 Tax=Tetrabaena socialis TaxID=47790 RepID=A0A2J8A508_9CHLO|nr:hypothetical protein TSOC_005930 [Tetrabaena socialis]|eukprot:PNH07590.1 hypothetical protein TSOC_005930 [Tetrabaena socialis]
MYVEGRDGHDTTSDSHVDNNTALLTDGGAIGFNQGLRALTVSVNSSISGNIAVAGSGGALYVRGCLGSMVLIDNSSISGNRASGGSGGAISIAGEGPNPYDTSILSVTGNSRMESNYAAYEGGAWSTKRSLISISVASNSSVSYNSAQMSPQSDPFRGGGAVSVLQVLGSISLANGSRMSHNTAKSGGGGAVLVYGDTSSVSISEGSQMDGNIASTGGGAYFTFGDLDVLRVTGNSSLSNNSTIGVAGGAVYVDQALGSIVVASGSHMSYNSVPGYGGAVYMAGSGVANGFNTSLSVSDVDGYTFNEYYDDWLSPLAPNVSSCIPIGARTANDLGRLCDDTPGCHSFNLFQQDSDNVPQTCLKIVTVTVPLVQQQANYMRRPCMGSYVREGSQMDGNIASTGGGAYFTFGDLDVLRVTGNSSLSNNSTIGVAGGAVYVDQALGSIVVASGSHMSYNSVPGYGGAVYMAGSGVANGFNTSLSVSGGSQMNGNYAQEHGGALYTTWGMDVLSVANNSSVSNNTARSGGAVFASQAIRHITVANGSSMSYNSVPGYGGAVYMAGSGVANGFNTSLSVSGGSQMNGNYAQEHGGALYTTWGMDVLSVANNSSVSNNTARSGVCITGNSPHYSGQR